MKFNVKKYSIKILIIISLLLSIFLVNTYASTTGFKEYVNGTEILKLSNKTWDTTKHTDIVVAVKDTGMNILGIIKTLLQWILLIYIIYIWIQMVISMGTDEDKLTKWKNQLWYSLVAIMFINIPWTIYKVVKNNDKTDLTELHTQWWPSMLINNTDTSSGSLASLLSNIVSFIEVIIFWLALFTIVMHWIKIMASRWREEEVTKAKSKILYSLIAWIFVGFIEGWRRLAMENDLAKWWELFWSMSQIALVFAWPVAIFYLTLAWYYYITSNWDDDKVKKAKNIIVNTLIWVILLWAMFTFLNDLSKF